MAEMDKPSGIAVIILNYDAMLNDIEFGVGRTNELNTYRSLNIGALSTTRRTVRAAIIGHLGAVAYIQYLSSQRPLSESVITTYIWLRKE